MVDSIHILTKYAATYAATNMAEIGLSIGECAFWGPLDKYKTIFGIADATVHNIAGKPIAKSRCI